MPLFKSNINYRTDKILKCDPHSTIPLFKIKSELFLLKKNAQSQHRATNKKKFHENSQDRQQLTIKTLNYRINRATTTTPFLKTKNKWSSKEDQKLGYLTKDY